jgi:hypothetical protein
LANLAGVSRFRLTLWESGDGPLSEAELSKLLIALQSEARARLSQLAGFVEVVGR